MQINWHTIVIGKVVWLVIFLMLRSSCLGGFCLEKTGVCLSEKNSSLTNVNVHGTIVNVHGHTYLKKEEPNCIR